MTPESPEFEPQVGEIRALRTFRIGADGRLFPLFHDRAWSDVTNAAQCALPQHADGATAHVAPEPDCTCGFYAYGSEIAALDYPHARHVLAVVCCWGKVIAGTRGIRAEHACLQAIWLSPAVPADLVRRVADRYPSAAVYASKDLMLEQNPITMIDSYEVDSAPLHTGWRVGAQTAIVAAALLSLVPAPWVAGLGAAAMVWAVPLGLLLTAAVVTARGARDLAAKRQWVAIVAAAIWSLAPIGGTVGWLLIRIPMIELVTLIALQRRFMLNDARRFPARIGEPVRPPQPRTRRSQVRRNPPA